jgi:hypothetical protein
MDRLEAALGGYDAAAGPGASQARDGAQPQPRVRYVRIDGSHDSAQRLAAVRTFRGDLGVRVALLSITAAGVCVCVWCGGGGGGRRCGCRAGWLAGWLAGCAGPFVLPPLPGCR